MRKKYLVTGGAGFIGSAIVKKLIEKGYQVRVLDNLQRGDLRRLTDIESEIEFVSADIRDSNKVIKAAKDCNGIIHLAYVNGTKFFYSKPELVLDIGVRGMLSVIEAGKQNEINELYVASSSEVYQAPEKIPTPEEVNLVVPDPYNPRFSYGGGKIITELMAIHMGKSYFKKIVIFRPHNVYGPDMGSEHVIPEFISRLSKIKNHKLSMFKIQGTGNETRSFIYIDDFVEGFMKILKLGRNLTTYNIGTQQEISSKELAVLVANILGKEIEVVPGVLQKGSTARRCPDISKIKKLGFKPRVGLKEGIKNTSKWYL